MSYQDRGRNLLVVLIPLILVLSPSMVFLSAWALLNDWPGVYEERTAIILVNLIAIGACVFLIKYARSELGWFCKK